MPSKRELEQKNEILRKKLEQICDIVGDALDIEDDVNEDDDDDESREDADDDEDEDEFMI